MNKFLKWPFLKFIKLTKKIVQRIAEAYDIRVDRSAHADGIYPLIIAKDSENMIPKTVRFNTMCGKINVGKNTVFGHDVKVLTGKHCNVEEATKLGKPLHFVPESGRDISIGNGCYIGANTIIIGPVSIGDYSMIGAGSIVTKNIPDYSFAVGAPAKVVKTLKPYKDSHMDTK